MKKFLLKVALFLVLFVVTFALPIVIGTAVRSRVSLEIPQDETILFIGDSHIVRGVNDKLIPDSFNWAKAAESYPNMFPRTKKLLEANPQIRTVFISATPRSLKKHADSGVFNGDAGSLLELNIIFCQPEDLVDRWKTIANALTSPRPQRIAALRAIRSKAFSTLGEFGGFEDLGNSSELLWKEIANDGKLGKKRLSEGNDKYGNALQVKYLREIVEFVRARGGEDNFSQPANLSCRGILRCAVL